MTRFKGFLGGLLTVLALVAMLVVWIALPWFAVLGIAVAIGLWLFLTRGGRLAREAAKIGIAGLPQRWGASLVIVVGIAGVVGVLVAMLAMGEGFKATLDKTGGTDSAILLRAGSQAETNSVITRDQVPLISTLPGIAKGTDGKPLASAELSQIINLPSMADGTDANVQLRGVGPTAWTLRSRVKIVEGRKFGAAVVLTFQALGQMRHRYGPQIAEAMLGCSNTKLFLQTIDSETRVWASQTIGECEVEIQTMTDALADGDDKPRTTLSKIRKMRPAILESELRLPKFEGYLLFPDGLPVTAGSPNTPSTSSRSWNATPRSVPTSWNSVCTSGRSAAAAAR